MKRSLLLLVFHAACILSLGQIVELTPLKDNTIFSENNNKALTREQIFILGGPAYMPTMRCGEPYYNLI